jgi:hypothetical protein
LRRWELMDRKGRTIMDLQMYTAGGCAGAAPCSQAQDRGRRAAGPGAAWSVMHSLRHNPAGIERARPHAASHSHATLSAWLAGSPHAQ